MKRLLVTLLLLSLTVCAVQAQVGVYRSNGVVKKEKKEHKEKRERKQRERKEQELREFEMEMKMREEQRVRDSIAREERKVRDAELAQKRQERQERISKMEWTNSVLLNYAWTFVGGTSNLGVTYSRCKLGGFYVSVMSGLEWHTADVDGFVTQDGYYNGQMVSNEKSHPRISFTTGIVIRFDSAPVWAYGGVGYAYRGLNYRTVDGKWVKYGDKQYNLGNCADIEVGVMGSIKGFTLQAGFSLLVSGDAAAEVKVGIGYTFKNKKKKTIEQEGGEQ